MNKNDKKISLKRKKNINISQIVLNTTFFIISFMCILPLVLVTAISLTDEKSIRMYGYAFIPKKISFYAYEYIFSQAESIIRSYGVSILVTILGTLTGLLVMTLLAYPLSRKDFKFRNHFSFFVFFTMLFNGGLVPWYIVCVQVLGLKNSIVGLIFPYLVNAWYVIILRTFFATNIPIPLIESAKIDGAGEYRIFYKIVLPLSLPVLATVGLFLTLTFWNDWWLGLVFITDEKLMPLQYLLMRVQRSIQYLSSQSGMVGNTGDILASLPQESARMAMAVVAIGPIIFAYPFFQKYFIKGLTVGSIKG